MILRVFLYGLLVYFAYRLIFDFIVPVYKTTKKLKKGFREMNERMQESQKEQKPFQPPPSQSGPKPSKSGDYIDFEEISR